MKLGTPQVLNKNESVVFVISSQRFHASVYRTSRAYFKSRYQERRLNLLPMEKQKGKDRKSFKYQQLYLQLQQNFNLTPYLIYEF